VPGRSFLPLKPVGENKNDLEVCYTLCVEFCIRRGREALRQENAPLGLRVGGRLDGSEEEERERREEIEKREGGDMRAQKGDF
jgi:hypothetical protein